MIETKKVPERAVLVSVCASNMTMERTEEYLSELAFLLDTAGGVPIKTFIYRQRQYVFRHFPVDLQHLQGLLLRLLRGGVDGAPERP